MQLQSRIIKLPEVMKQTGLSAATVYRYMENNIFPTQLKIGLRAVGWEQEAVTAWLDQRRQESLKQTRN